MPTFTYQALGTGGRKSSGEMEARSRNEVFHRLEQDGLQVVSLTQKDVDAGDLMQKNLRGKESVSLGKAFLSRAQIIVFTEELSDLLEAGLQLEPALKAMEKRTELGGLKDVVTALREKVVKGTSFSTSIQSVSDSFGDLYCNLVTAGEISGSLPSILKRQAEYLKTLDDLQSRVIQSLIYPAFIIGAGILLMIVFMTTLIPQLTKLLSETGKSMPFMTRMLIGISDFATNYGLFVLVFVIIVSLIFWYFIEQPKGRIWWDEQKVKLPLIGGIIAARYYAQFSQTLANLVGNGIPLLNSLKLMQPTTPNLFFRKQLLRVVDVVGEGGSFSRALKGVGHFPPLFIDMVSVGEQTGDMGLALDKVARRYDLELSRRIQRLTALIQPVIIVVMALVVGAVAYAMISGIFETISGLRTK
ncbi:MAG: type II secretion system F family protein [Blastochloris sp.]|nr:type II secretion system F family protein [Blastochloris sp.]